MTDPGSPFFLARTDTEANKVNAFKITSEGTLVLLLGKEFQLISTFTLIPFPQFLRGLTVDLIL